jgi:thiol reductant ABC exporter CydC subunit
MIARLARLADRSRTHVALSVLFGFIAIGSSVALMATSGYLISKAALRPPILELAVAIVAVRAFAIGRGVFRYMERLMSHDLALRLLAELRVRLYRRLEPLAPGGLAAFRSGDLLARMVADAEALQDFFVRALAPPMVAALILGLAAGILWPLAPPVVPVTVASFVVAGLVLPWLARRIARPLATRHASCRGELAVELVELLQGAPEIAVFGRGGEHLARVRRLDIAQSRAGTHLASLGAGLDASVSTLGVLAVGGSLALAIPLIAPGRLDGVYVATIALTILAAFEAVQVLPDASRRLEQSLAAAARLFEIEDRKPPVIDGPNVLDAQTGTIALEGAWLRYRTSGPWALADVNLRLDPGRRVALVGSSGAGKTSVANVLLRFRELDGGRAMLNGRDLRNYSQESVRHLIGMSEENPHLFNTTIRANIALARPDATQSEIEAAAHTARIVDWIDSLPDGWETNVGQGGGLVSGGQRQRISLARAILADFPVLILDEPTANLERRLARELMNDLFKVTQDRSLLLITHRLEGLDAMDEIVIIEGGRIVERGTHDQLLAQKGHYGEMLALAASQGDPVG